MLLQDAERINENQKKKKSSSNVYYYNTKFPKTTYNPLLAPVRTKDMIKLSPCAFLISQFLISTIALPVRALGPLGNNDSVFSKRTTLAPGFTWGTGPMRGVNIGGWLVLEVRPFLPSCHCVFFV